MDIVVPFLEVQRGAASNPRTIYVYQIPGTTGLFAWQHFDHRSAASDRSATQMTKKAAGLTGGL
ncbi:hypothetical protein KMZ68_10310 [Bradyrhizobium sediminis]|uniref:Uncharacterized protein n=1 Tax=Bradyrhizobium sediminis TaxID=2840469 RepID=A0A975NT12_9BRAD|nr:hypothetical protein [Bradyrhizobium sediminis]QWG20186.1 hypothetical protein KMZ68_10310 [Bradyrhizobium sediminis]